MTHDQKLELLKHLYPNTGNRDIAKLINMHYTTVRYYGEKFGLKKNEELIVEQIKDSVSKSLEIRRASDLRHKLLAEKSLTYWERVKEFKKDQFETHGRLHPFYKLQFKSQANG
jgi:hypothetical protein